MFGLQFFKPSGSISGYTIVGTLGEGAYASVLKCRSNEGDIVAVKRVKALDPQKDTDVDVPYVYKCLKREIVCLSKVQHRNVVKLIEAIFDGKSNSGNKELSRKQSGSAIGTFRKLDLVFECLDSTLLDYIADHPKGDKNGPRFKRYCFQLICAVEACHAAGVVHRDIKPDNVLMSRDRTIVKLADFGVSRNVLKPGDRVGLTPYSSTRWYRAPEMLFCTDRYSPKVDVWAVGCVCAELATGHPLFSGETEQDQLQQIQRVMGKFADEQIKFFRKRVIGFRPHEARTTSLKDVLGGGTCCTFIGAALKLDPRKRTSAKCARTS